MKFIGKRYSLYTKDFHKIPCRSAKFLWKSKFCLGSGSGSGWWFYLRFQYQTYIPYIEKTPIKFCLDPLTPSKVIVYTSKVHVRADRRTDRQTDGNFFVLVLSSKTYKKWTLIERRQFFFFFHSCDYNTFSFYILRMWWESKNGRPFSTEAWICITCYLRIDKNSHLFILHSLLMRARDCSDWIM